MKWIKNEVSYQEIAKNNTEEDLMAARHAVWYVEDEINGMVKSDEYDQNTMRKKFQEITGYKYNEIEKYIKDIRASQYKELTAAYDYKKSKQRTRRQNRNLRSRERPSAARRRTHRNNRYPRCPYSPRSGTAGLPAGDNPAAPQAHPCGHPD